MTTVTIASDSFPERKLSPMFRHAIESFEHGLEHFLDGTDRSRKFALLHIDHAIELMLKEKCVQLGKSPDISALLLSWDRMDAMLFKPHRISSRRHPGRRTQGLVVRDRLQNVGAASQPMTPGFSCMHAPEFEQCDDRRRRRMD